MSEISKFEAQRKKLDGICEENNLVAIFRNDSYPITLTIRPLTGLDEQMSMLENAEEKGYTSPDASLVITVTNCELSHRFYGTFAIDDRLLQKLKSIFKKMHDFWVQFFFRDLMEKGILNKSNMPKIDGEDIPEGAEPLESFDDDEDELTSDGDLPGGEEDEGAESVSVSLEDPDIREAVRIVRAENKAATALLQREMGIGYSKAARLMEQLEALGVVGPFNGSQPREVLPYDEPEDEGDLS